MKVAQAAIDKTAIVLSIICTIHCLLLPLAMTMLPALGATSLGGASFHRLLLLAILPASMIALTMGCRKHRHLHVVFIGSLGLIILTLTAFFGHELLGEAGEKMATVSGAAIIAFGHLRNHALCRHFQCHCQTD